MPYLPDAVVVRAVFAVMYFKYGQILRPIIRHRIAEQKYLAVRFYFIVIVFERTRIVRIYFQMFGNISHRKVLFRQHLNRLYIRKAVVRPYAPEPVVPQLVPPRVRIVVTVYIPIVVRIAYVERPQVISSRPPFVYFVVEQIRAVYVSVEGQRSVYITFIVAFQIRLQCFGQQHVLIHVHAARIEQQRQQRVRILRIHRVQTAVVELPVP